MPVDTRKDAGSKSRASEMTDGTLLGILQSKLTNSIGFQGGKLAQQRLLSERYYRGDKLGNEQDGRSQVVSRDVAEAIDSLMPAMMKIFASMDEIVRFEPQGKEFPESMPQPQVLEALKKLDRQATQATDYVNWIVTQQNDWFRVFFSAAKDAFMFKLGVSKIWWDDKETNTRETYKGLTEEEYEAVIASDDVTVVSDKTRPDPDWEPPPPAPPPMPPMMGALPAPSPMMAAPGAPGALPAPPGAPAPAPGQLPLQPGSPAIVPPEAPSAPLLHDCTVRITNKKGRVRIEAVPPDEFLVERRTVSLDDTPFLAHRFKKAITDVKLMFPDKLEQIDKLPAGEENEYGMERIERFKDEDELPFRNDNPADQTMREVWLSECYIRVDFDADGYAEWRKVTVVGDTNSVLLDNEEVDDHPFSAGTPIIFPHKLHGTSIADLTQDVQLIKTTLLRAILDTTYNAVMPQLAVVADRVNMDDLMTRRPGGIVRTTSLEAVEALPNPGVGEEPYQLIEYFDTVRESRTGVQRWAQGPGPDSLKNAYSSTATGANIVQSATQDRQDLIAATLGHSYVKRLVKRVLELVCKHQDKPRIIRLRGSWSPMDPREWSTEMDIKVQVGLGSGSRDQKMQLMTNLVTITKDIIMQQGGLDGPLVTAENLYNQIAKICVWGGLPEVDPFFTDPSKAPPGPPKPQKPDPQVQAAQINAQAKQQEAQLDAQTKEKQMAIDNQQKTAAMQADINLRREIALTEISMKRELAYAQLMLDREKLGLEVHRTHVETQLEQAKHETDSAIKRKGAGFVKRHVQVHRDDAGRISGAVVNEIPDAPPTQHMHVQRDGAGRISDALVNQIPGGMPDMPPASGQAMPHVGP